MENSIVTNIQRYSIHDGPGIRTLVFFKGCPLRCQWCSNPEGQLPYPEVMQHGDRCVGCGMCKEACPQNAITYDREHKAVIDRGLCNGCMACVSACLNNALETSGVPMSIDQIVERCLRDMAFYKKSDGGVTLSGGEPFGPGAFTLRLISELKKQGIHVAAETTGYVDPALLEQSQTDLFLFDVKAADPQLHLEGTGVDNRLILSNLQKLIAAGRDVLVRMPMIPGFNMGSDNIEKTGKILSEIGVKDVELLPYHRLGVAKYQLLSRPYFCTDAYEPSEEMLQDVRDRLQSYGLTCVTR